MNTKHLPDILFFCMISMALSTALLLFPGTCLTVHAEDHIYFDKVTKTADITDGQYLIVYEEGSVALDGSLETLDHTNNSKEVILNNSRIEVQDSQNEGLEVSVFTINVSKGTLKSASGLYIGTIGFSNALGQSEDEEKYKNTFSIDGNGNAIIQADFEGSYMCLKYNNTADQCRFRYYNSSSQKPICLYKMVSEVAKPDPSVTKEPALLDKLTYIGEDLTLVNAGEVEGGTMQYAIGTDGENAPTEGWSSNLPKKKDAGSYHVWFSVKGDTTHNDLPPEYLGEVTISKVDPEVTTPDNLTATYGQKLSDVSLSNGWAWENADASVGDVGGNAFSVTFTPDDTGNYNTLTRELTVSVGPKEIGLSWSETSFVYDEQNHVPKATATGLIGEDICEVTVEGEQKEVGTYKATAVGVSNSNYKLPTDVEMEFTITAKQEDPSGTTENPSGTTEDPTATTETPATTTETPAATTEKQADKPEIVKVSKITLSGISKKIAAGKKIKLQAVILPINASNKKLKWTSSDPKLATVTQSGKVSVRKKAGGKTVTIRALATDGSKISASWKIKVMKGAVTKVTIQGAKKKLKAGKTMKLKAVVKVTKRKPVNKKLKWSSSNPKYVTVTKTGKVKALKAGIGKKVKITAMATDGTGKKKRVTIKIVR